MRFRSPTASAGRAALPGAADIRAIPLRRFSIRPAIEPGERVGAMTLAGLARRGRWRDGPFALAVFRLRPHRAAPRPDETDVGLPHRTLRAPARRGSCTAASLTGRCSATRLEPSHDSAGARVAVPRRRSWGSTLRGVAPARGCRGVSAPRTHLPFFSTPRPVRGVCCERHRPAGALSPTFGPRARAAAGSSRGSWASSPRAVGSRDRAPRRSGRTARVHTALGFSSLRSSDAGAGNRLAFPAARGFRGRARRDATGEVAPRDGALCVRAKTGGVAVILSNGHRRHLWQTGPSATCAGA